MFSFYQPTPLFTFSRSLLPLDDLMTYLYFLLSYTHSLQQLRSHFHRPAESIHLAIPLGATKVDAPLAGVLCLIRVPFSMVFAHWEMPSVNVNPVSQAHPNGIMQTVGVRKRDATIPWLDNTYRRSVGRHRCAESEKKHGRTGLWPPSQKSEWIFGLCFLSRNLALRHRRIRMLGTTHPDAREVRPAG